MAVAGKREVKDLSSVMECTNNFCEACLDNNATTEADGVCKECKEYMCNTCFEHHLKARQCRNHVFVDRDSTLVLEKDDTCLQHNNEVIKYYCRTHQQVGCGDCMVLVHNECKPDFIENYSKVFEQNEEFKAMVQQLDALESAVKYHEDKVKNDIKELKTLNENVLKEIKGFKAIIVEMFDKAEANILGYVDELTSEYAELLVKLGNDLKKISYRIDRVKMQMNTNNFRGNALFVRFIQNKPEITKIKQTLEQITLSHNLHRFEFKPNKQFIDFLTAEKSFGSLECCEHSDGLKDHTEHEVDDTDDVNDTGLISIGMRVRPLPDCKYGISSHNKQPGTIELVECCGKIAVKWDYSGEVKYGYRIGRSKCGNGLELI